MPNPTLNRVKKEQMPKNIQNDYNKALNIRDDATFMEIAANAPEVYDWYKDSFYGTRF